MAKGYMGKLLFVNLSTEEIKDETPDESLYRNFIGGYGVGARMLYNHQKGGIDPLGPENTLGLITGPLRIWSLSILWLCSFCFRALYAWQYRNT
jgi:aldehyde:ferredoxin oxidoreductase